MVNYGSGNQKVFVGNNHRGVVEVLVLGGRTSSVFLFCILEFLKVYVILADVV